MIRMYTPPHHSQPDDYAALLPSVLWIKSLVIFRLLAQEGGELPVEQLHSAARRLLQGSLMSSLVGWASAVGSLAREANL